MPEIVTDQQFLEFYDENIGKIYRFIYFRVSGKQEAQDLTSDVFLKAWQYVADGNKVENLRALLYQVARNSLIDHYRDKDRKTLSLDEARTTDESEKALIESLESVTKVVDNNLGLERIKKALKNIKSEYQEVVILRYLNDYSLREVAELMGKSYGAVRVLVNRGLRALKKELS